MDDCSVDQLKQQIKEAESQAQNARLELERLGSSTKRMMDEVKEAEKKFQSLEQEKLRLMTENQLKQTRLGALVQQKQEVQRALDLLRQENERLENCLNHQ